MNWIRISLLALFTLCVTGSAAYLMINGCTCLFKVKNPYIRLAMQKAATAAFVIPVLFAALFFRHAGGIFRRTDKSIDGVFWVDRLKLDDGICLALELIWLCGFVVELLKTLRAQRRLNRIWRQNRPVTGGLRREIFEQCRARFGLSKVELLENPALPSPVSAKSGLFLIVLPAQPYSRKELHMIFAHEMNHIRHHDLWWRRLVLAGELINWYHPWQHMLEKSLIAEQEIVCDLRASTNHPLFTQREYGAFLVSQSDHEYGNLPVTAFQESKNITIRRLSAMAQAKKMKKPKGWHLAASCAGMMAAALLPAAAVSAHVIAWEEERIYASETGERVEATGLENSGEVHTAYADDDPSVVEVNLTEEMVSEESGIKIYDGLLVGNERKIIQMMHMPSGGKITISIFCDNENAGYRIGVKNVDTNEIEYIEGNDFQAHTCYTPVVGTYCIYVENMSGQLIKIHSFINCDTNIDRDKTYADYVTDEMEARLSYS